jgi:hypothetical protein
MRTQSWHPGVTVTDIEGQQRLNRSLHRSVDWDRSFSKLDNRRQSRYTKEQGVPEEQQQRDVTHKATIEPHFLKEEKLCAEAREIFSVYFVVLAKNPSVNAIFNNLNGSRSLSK